MSFLGQLASLVAPHLGGTVLQGAQEGKTAQQITAMLGGALRATSRAPKASDLPQRDRSVVEGASRTMMNLVKIFPKSEVVQREAAKEQREEINIRHQAMGHVKMGPAMTDPAFLQTMARGGRPEIRPDKLPVSAKLVTPLSRLTTAITALNPAVGLATKASLAVAGATVAAITMSRAQLRGNERLGHYDARIAATMARMNIQQIQLDYRRARATAASTETLGSAIRGLNETLAPFEQAGAKTRNYVAAGVAKIVDVGMEIATYTNLWLYLLKKWGESGEDKEDKEGGRIPFQHFLRTMNPRAEPRNQRVILREGPHRRGE